MEQPHFGVARWSISGDMEEGLGYVTLAQSLLRNTLEQMRVRNLNHLTGQMRLPGDAYCYVICSGGYNQVFVVAGNKPSEKLENPEIVRVEIPDFISGAVQNGFQITIEQSGGAVIKTVASFHPTHECSIKFELPESFQSIKRLDVSYIDEFAGDLKPPEKSRTIYTQYTKLKATMWSGHMRGLIQVLMGFAKQRRVGQREVSLYETHTKKAGKPKPVTAYQRDVADNGLRIQYDWRFTRTHGLIYGPDNKPWIVEIGLGRGAVAWPLPLNDLTTTPEFLQRMQDKGDEEAVAILQAYGGFPTGEPLPTGDEGKAWIRAGRMLEIVSADDMAPFYDCTAYSTDCGWAFNLRGDEAHNTASYYHPDGLQRGVHYMVRMSVGATRPKVEHTVDVGPVRVAIASLPARAGKAAALWKLDYLDDFEVRSARSAAQRSAEEAYQYVDQLELAPLAPNNGNLSKVSEGYLFFPWFAKRNNGNIIRWPEHALGYLVSKDMRPAVNVAPPSGTVIDTTMHVMFVGDEMHWVKFFWDTRPGANGAHDDDYEDCMYVGQWSSHTETGLRPIPMMFYTSTIDDRAELAGEVTDIKIKGIDLGYNGITATDFAVIHGNCGYLTRSKRFMRTTITDTVTGEGMVNGVAIPFYNREAYYYGILKSNTQKSHTESHGYLYLGDPWSYMHWRNKTFWTGDCKAGGPPNGNCPSDGDDYDGTGQWRKLDPMPWGGCGPVTSRTVVPPNVDIRGGFRDPYEPSPCSDFADSGPWAVVCDNATAMAYSIPEPPLPAPVSTTSPASGQYTVWLVDSDGPRTIKRQASLSAQLWPAQTPDPENGATQYMEHGQNVFGTAVISRYSTDINEGTILTGGPQWPGLNSGFLTFIGVNNG